MATMQHQHQFAFAFGLLGNLISGLVYLAPIPTFYRIYKRKSTESFRSLPYLVALFSSMLWLYYALMKKDEPHLITINSAGCFIESFYIVIFIIYATRDARILTVKLFMALNVTSSIMILVTTQFLIRDHTLSVKVLGWICVSVAVIVFAAPLCIVVEVFRTKSVEFMPFYLSLSLTLSAIVWFFYGLFIKDIHITIPNVLGFTLGMLQIIVYAIYRDGEAKNMEGRDEERTIEAIIVIPLGSTTCEVHPIPIKDHVNIEQGIEGAEEKEKNVEG